MVHNGEAALGRYDRQLARFQRLQRNAARALMQKQAVNGEQIMTVAGICDPMQSPQFVEERL
jgi:hypothetical protein